MRLNKKGFVASATMYSLLVLFIALIVGLLVLFANRKMILDKLKDDIKSEINMADVYSYYDSKVVYYNPVTDKFCGNYDEENSKDGVKTGCLKWYLYDGSKSSKSVKLILDHNTTLKTSKEDVESELAKLTTQYSWRTSAKAITAEEIAKATKKSQFNSNNSSSWYYFDNGSQTEPNNRKIFNYTGNVQTYNVTSDGIYKLQAWGAQGGGLTSNPGGKGAYTSGLLSMNKGEYLQVYVGNYGYKPAIVSKPFNGGGVGDLTGTWASSHNGEFSGGGATDFRFFNDEPSSTELQWDNTKGLNARIMVAGGGGAGNNGDGSNGGAGGTLNGVSSINPSTGVAVTAPTQTSGFGFGIGQGSGKYSSDGGADTGAGGGGYYGGYRGTSTNTGGSGGSSFVSGYQGCVAVNSESSNSPKSGCANGTTDVSCSYHPTNKVFTDPIMIAGNASMPTVDGTSSMTGKAEDGAAAITRISKTAWLYDNTYNCDNYGCLYKDNETNGYWTGTGTWAVSNTGKISMIDSNSTDYGVRPAIEISKLDYGEYEEEAEYSYKGKPQQFIAPKTGKYKIELWGAQGGSYSSSVVGGKGSYTTGEIELKENEIIYLYVGGQPSVASTANYSSGGWNGGGNSGYNATTNFSRGGGGATDVRLINGEWNNSKGLNSRIMVAAGGGGSVQDGTKYLLSGAAGGTLSGNNGVSSYSSTTPTGGTQTSYGTGKHTEADRIAGFGYGGGKQTPGTNTGWGGGGGSGYYGGALGHGFPGASGSSYISGHQGCVAIKSETNSGAKKGCSTGTTDTSCSYHYSGKKFNETNMIAGNASMPTYDGESVMTGNSGNGHAKITLIETKDVNVEKFYYKSKAQTFTAPKDGTYKIELWGASGGEYPPTYPYAGNGAYTSGEIELTKGEKLYVYVGGMGKDTNAAYNLGGWNGGGASGNYSSGGLANAGGGGSTDVRLIGGAWDNTKGLRSRIMVAAGGGGTGNYSGYTIPGGYGGALTGGNGTCGNGNYEATVGATQTAGGKNAHIGAGAIGGFGIGNQTAADGGYGGGAGGGYFAGSEGYGTGGSGGSSYVSGYTGCVAVESVDSTSPKSGCANGTTDVACSYHYSGKKFTNPTMIAGNEGMPSYNGKSTMTGNEGNGFAKITYIGDKDDNVEEFKYTGNVQTFTVPQTGTYKLEVWGAQGGNKYNTDKTAITAGFGGYSVGNINLTKDQVLYVFVGEQGKTTYQNQIVTPNIDYKAYPNGGSVRSATSTNNINLNGGGGSTHIALQNKLIEQLTPTSSDLLIVAGGGGGIANYWSIFHDGGSGGGFTGVSTTGNFSNKNTTGGTQSAGGSGGGNADVNTYAGRFGIGGGSILAGTGSVSGGGGGGYYGGGASWGGSGAGGSGYIGNSQLTEKHMACYNCSTSTADSTKTISVSSYSSEPEVNKAKAGYGFARITFMGA